MTPRPVPAPRQFWMGRDGEGMNPISDYIVDVTPDPRANQFNVSRDAVAGRLRDWIHTTPMSLCNRGVDTCPDWKLAYELADIALGNNT